MNLLAFVVNTCMTWAVLFIKFLPYDVDELSDKYSVVITPADTAFSIWGIIFMLELMFIIGQLTCYRHHPAVEVVTPWWIAACILQTIWTPANGLDLQYIACVAIWGIGICLVAALVEADAVPEVSGCEEFVLLSGLGVHAGWIICASWLSVSIVGIRLGMQEGEQLVVAIISLVMILLTGSSMVVSRKRPVWVVPLVAAWAGFWINQALNDPEVLKRHRDTTREFYVPWTDRVLTNLATTGVVVSLVALSLALAGLYLRVMGRSEASPVVKGESEPMAKEGAVEMSMGA